MSFKTSTIYPIYNTNILPYVIPSNINVPSNELPVLNVQKSTYYLSYLDVNTDKNLRNAMSKYFYDKIFDYWIMDEYKSLLSYVVVFKGIAKLAKSKEEINKSENFNIAAKILFLKEFISKSLVKSILKRFVQKNNVNWYDLKKYKDEVKDYLYSKLKQEIKKHMINI